MEYKVFDFELKKLEEDGTFEGYAAIFRKGKDSDLGGDRIDPGAFLKTLQENPNIPLHWYHDLKEPVGEATGEEDKIGLKIKGQLVLDVQRAKELHALMKKTKRVARQLSIGYNAVKWEMDDNIRALKELRLWEIGIVTYGMDQSAFITDVKCADCPLKKKPEIKMELKPYPNEHSARLQDPDKFDPDTFRRKSDGTIYGKIKVPETVDVIWGKLKGHSKPSDNPIPQALRFPTKDWTVAEAKKWLKDNNVEYIDFEPAKKSLAGEALTALLETAEPPDEDTQKAEKPQDKPGKPNDHLLEKFFSELEKLNSVMGGKN